MILGGWGQIKCGEIMADREGRGEVESVVSVDHGIILLDLTSLLSRPLSPIFKKIDWNENN